MSWTTLRLRTVTPTFNSDGDPELAEIRVSSIRGEMHTWLRAMAGILAGDDPTLLRAMENRVLGSTKHASPIRLRVPKQPDSVRARFPDFLQGRDQGRWIAYLLGPGLTNWSRDDSAMELNRAFIPAGQEFELKVRLDGTDHDAHKCALAALWLSLTYGGIGARTRRGFGAVRIVDVEGPLPEQGWPKSSLTTPSLEHYEKTSRLWPGSGPAADAMPSLMAIAKEAAEDLCKDKVGLHVWKGAPPYPVLSKEHTIAGVTGGAPFSRWESVLTEAGKELRYFRASEDTPGVRYKPEIKTREWLEVVHDEERNDFALGGLGLPIVFKKEIEVHADSGVGQEAEKLRRASPLRFKPVGEGDRWKLFSYSFLTEFLPQDASVHLWEGKGSSKKQGRRLTVTTEDSHTQVRDWVEGMAEAEEAAFVRD
ncbi:type III-B CRISPR module RAMP protein Cmr1 [Nocardiopsis alba]|uniref:type III-B CRISPR module RAMP protein Cmr1 n=1 Tax=Nocardiopsis alba TaxID=53437 RepID=UPI0036712796